MTITAGQFADTLRFLLPGFIAAKTLYALGVQTKRSDAQWALWSVLLAAPILYVGDALVPLAGAAALVIDIPVAIALGALLALAWRLASARWPLARAGASIHAWDELFTGEPRWIEITLKDGCGTYLGYASSVASSVETDDLDILLASPETVEDGVATPIAGVESVLMRRADIARILVHAPTAPSESPSRQAPARTT